MTGQQQGWTPPPPPPLGAPATRTPAARLLGGICALVGAALVILGTFLPWARPEGSDALSIIDCGVAGCPWFAVEPLVLAAAVIVTGIVLLAARRAATVAAWLLVSEGLWGILFFLGFLGQALAGEGLSPQAAGFLGLGGGALTVVGGLLGFAGRR